MLVRMISQRFNHLGIIKESYFKDVGQEAIFNDKVLFILQKIQISSFMYVYCLDQEEIYY